MTPRLTTDYAKNNCNWTLIVKVIADKKAQLWLRNPRHTTAFQIHSEEIHRN